MKISFDVSKTDGDLIAKIVDRAERTFTRIDRLSTTMDIAACHANGNPLRLADLLATDNFNFIHDVGGIIRHIDRNTGKLTGHFSPRFSAPQ